MSENELYPPADYRLHMMSSKLSALDTALSRYHDMKNDPMALEGLLLGVQGWLRDAASEATELAVVVTDLLEFQEQHSSASETVSK